MTQQVLAERADCSVSYVRLLEAGMTPQTSAVLPRIAAVLDLNDDAPAGNGRVGKERDAGAHRTD